MDCCLKQYCEICCTSNVQIVEMNCKHQLCLQCFQKAVVPKELCPYCKQIVIEMTIDNKIIPISEFEKPQKEEINFFEEAQFQLVDQNFFEDDLRTLNMNLLAANQHMLKTIRQTDQKFEEKWFAFEQIAQQIANIQFNGSVEIHQQIHSLNICIMNILSESWDSPELKQITSLYKLNNEEEMNFVIVEQKKKKNKRKQKS